jgi:eukaryotic-like serine/threonine-protein kinase
MTPQRWQQVKTALHEAMQLSPGARIAYLDHLSACDPELRLELDSLLAANEELGEGFLSAPAVVAAIEETELPDPLLGTRVGPYQLVEEIGSGGMGKVYRAVRKDDEFDQVVAIKLVRAQQGSSFVLNRMRSERQILAGLDHANITRLLDGGTTSGGLPYLVMEFVDGLPIEEYCAIHQLDVAAKLELFVQVCSAVHYAHQRLIVHRDIKPGNILITPQGAPKLLDFGIAKIFRPEGTLGRGTATVSVVRLLTPGYASPEQVKGGLITTATDIYSLGVVLYELLTGFAPRAIFTAQASTAKPSTLVRRRAAGQPRRGPLQAARAILARRLAGDLDNIVLKAMHADPERRYSSAEQLASDIRAYLQHRPVIARPDTLGYRISRFIARHSAAAILVASLSLALIAAAGVIWNEARIAQAERARAERRFNDVRRLARSLLREIYPSVQDLPGSTPARELIVGRALEYLDSLSSDAAGDIPLERELAAAYSLVGDVQGNVFFANLGKPKAALESYRKALLIRERIAAATPGDRVAAAELAGSYRQVGTALETLRDFDGALLNYRSSAQQFERLFGGGGSARELDSLAGQYYYLAEAAVEAGHLGEAERSIRRGMAIRRTIVAADALVRVDVLTHSAGDLTVAAQVLQHGGRLSEALEDEHQAIDVVTKLASENPNNQTLRSFLGQSLYLLAQTEEQAGKFEDALASYRRALSAVQPGLAVDPRNVRARYEVAENYDRIGALELQGGRLQNGLGDLTRAVETLSPLLASDLEYPDVRALFGDCYADLGRAHEALARGQRSGLRVSELRAAHEWYRQGLEKWRDLQTQGLLTAWEQDKPAELARSLAANELALAIVPAAR